MLDANEIPVPVQISLMREPMNMFRVLQTARRNLLEVVPREATFVPILSGRTGVRWHLLMDPDGLKHVLNDRFENYPKSKVVSNVLEPAIGGGLFVAEGAHWRWQRRAMAPVFSPRNIQDLSPFMTAAASASSDRLARGAGGQVDVFQEMMTAAFQVISDVTFSGSGAIGQDEVQGAVNDYLAGSAKVSVLDMFGAPHWIPRPGRMFKPRKLRQLKHAADKALAKRRADGPRENADLIDRMIAAEDPETKRRMTPIELRDNLLTFVVAGHETTALAMCWALYLLAFDPTVQERLRAEASSVLNGRVATAQDYAALPYTQQVVNEALRLYTPTAFLSRVALKKDTLCGRDILPGDNVVLPIYALHRNHLLWDRPDEFDPERFAPGNKIDRYAFLPFLDGPRKCIGAQFAMTEAVILLSTVVSRFKFSLVDGKVPKPQLLLTLRPENGIWLNVETV